MNRSTVMLSVVLFFGVLGVALFLRGDGPVEIPQTQAMAMAAPDVVLDSGPGVVQVYKTPTCGCCSGWVDHLREQGFVVEVQDLSNLDAVKASLGVDSDLMSCHTATVNGYVVEGHVPAGSIRRLLEERPAVAGIAAPGMPIGSPGMEGPNPEAYDIVAFDRSGGRSVFEHIDPAVNPGGGTGEGH